MSRILDAACHGRSITSGDRDRQKESTPEERLGPASKLGRWAGETEAPGAESERRLLTRAIRPFILRRTKAATLENLPERAEETVYCEMTPKQKRLYDQLREYYRVALDRRIRKRGFKGSGVYILEALLRLRQAAFHAAYSPAISRRQRGQSSIG
jgi:SNF2 family DNA or RNA helicase